uniref:Ig-like domain-containing protein n=1 Tax=Cyprinus carpio TaxID=7962 RepID=A0A8C1VY42_CYPCA
MLCVYSAGVIGATVVTQNPPLITVSKGETPSLVCNTGSSTDGGRWYKQVTGETPQFVLNSYHSWSSPKYGSGFSSSKFTVSYPTQSDCHLSINNVDVDDSEVYYCHTWDSSAKENVSQ